jgi:hypothetical protein
LVVPPCSANNSGVSKECYTMDQVMYLDTRFSICINEELNVFFFSKGKCLHQGDSMLPYFFVI